MKFKFNLDKKNYNDFLSIIESKYDVIYLSIYSILYFYITFYVLKLDFKIILIYFIISILMLYLIISLIKKLFRIIIIKKNKKYLGEYSVDVDKNKINQSINNDLVQKIEKKNIKNIKYKKYGIIIRLKNRYNVFFIKNIIKNVDYNKLVDYLKENC